MDIEDLNQTQIISEQHPKENRSEMTPSLEEEEVDSGQGVSSGTEVSQGANSGTAVNGKRDRRSNCLRRLNIINRN